MARIPEAEVQRLKDEIAVQRLIEATGIELKRVGKDLAGHCPFHGRQRTQLDRYAGQEPVAQVILAQGSSGALKRDLHTQKLHLLPWLGSSLRCHILQ